MQLTGKIRDEITSLPIIYTLHVFVPKVFTRALLRVSKNVLSSKQLKPTATSAAQYEHQAVQATLCLGNILCSST